MRDEGPHPNVVIPYDGPRYRVGERVRIEREQGVARVVRDPAGNYEVHSSKVVDVNSSTPPTNVEMRRFGERTPPVIV
jgi:hypothetical protein